MHGSRHGLLSLPARSATGTHCYRSVRALLGSRKIGFERVDFFCGDRVLRLLLRVMLSRARSSDRCREWNWGIGQDLPKVSADFPGGFHQFIAGERGALLFSLVHTRR